MEDRVLPIFKVSVPKYEKRLIQNKETVLYCIEITTKNGESWSLWKRYQELHNLNSDLKEKFSDLPPFPSKSLFPVKNHPDIEKRRIGLDTYMQGVINRQEILFDNLMINFLEVNKNFKTWDHPRLLTEIKKLPFPVSDFEYEPKEGLLFIGLSDAAKSVRELDSNDQTCGYVVCYRQGNCKQLAFEQVWKRKFKSSVTCLSWDPSLNLLAVGQRDGRVNMLRVLIKTNSVLFMDLWDQEVMEEKVAKVYINSEHNVLYSFGESSYFNSWDFKEKKLIAESQSGVFSYSSIVICKESKTAIMSDNGGKIYVYDLSEKIARKIRTITPKSDNIIKGIYFDCNSKSFLSIEDKGLIETTSLINETKDDKLSITPVECEIARRKSFTSIAGSPRKKSFYTGCEDGTILSWDQVKKSPQCVVKAHEGKITKLQICQNENLLISCGKDKNIAFYQLSDPSDQLAELNPASSLLSDQGLERYDLKKMDTRDSLSENI